MRVKPVKEIEQAIYSTDRQKHARGLRREEENEEGKYETFKDALKDQYKKKKHGGLK